MTPTSLRGWSGAHVAGNTTRFGLYSPTAERAAVRLFAADLAVRETHAMVACGDGRFALSLPQVRPGALYKFVLDGRELPDPYARFLPHGVHGPAQVMQPGYHFVHGAPVF